MTVKLHKMLAAQKTDKLVVKMKHMKNKCSNDGTN